MGTDEQEKSHLDDFTQELFQELFQKSEGEKATGQDAAEINALIKKARESALTTPIISVFQYLLEQKRKKGLSPEAMGLAKEDLLDLAQKHAHMDEHQMTVGGRLNQALSIVADAKTRVDDYMARKGVEAPSGLELWGEIQANMQRIQSFLRMDDAEWNSYSGQLRNCIDSVEKLSQVIDLPAATIAEVTRVTQSYRMRLTPYYASLIQPGKMNDPILLQSVPTAEMVDNVGIEIPPVAADHSPARLVDQFYPRVVTIKATNMCAMYCTHCLRLAHIGKKDRIYPTEAYQEALDYIRNNPLIRDVLITGGDAFVLPNKIIRDLLGQLDRIEHLKMKRLGTRIPVTSPQRVDDELLEILAESNDKKPVRVVTQINTAQEITPVSREAFRKLSNSAAAVLNQAVLLKGVNDSRVKMWKLCETIQESYVRPYYIFNCSYRNPQFAHFRVPVEKGRDIVESMYGNISGDAIPRYIATAGGKIPLHRSNVVGTDQGDVVLKKPWNGQAVTYPDADPDLYADRNFSFNKQS